MYDCVIVGAGPAGSAVAYHVARQGHSVLLLEKDALPRYKPCTGAVSPSIAQWFDFDFAPAIDRTIRRVRYTWKLGDEINSQLKTHDPIWMVKRDVFDTFLVKQAQGQGAEVQDSTPVSGIQFVGDRWQVQTAAGTFEGRYLIGADGAEGPTARWLGFKEHKLRNASVLEVPTSEPLDETCALNFEFGLVKSGCIWSFPKHQGYAIGACTFLGKPSQDFIQPLEKYVPTFGVRPDQGTAYSHGLKLWDGNRPLHTQQALLVGEAGAIVDPLVAEGIRPGIFSGVKAAEAIHQALNGDGEALSRYSDTIHQQWGADMQWAQRIAGVFYRVPGVGYKVGITRPTATDRLGQLLAGDVRYGDIANRVIKRLTTGFLPGRKG